MDTNEILKLTNAAWKEKVYIETTEHIICGYIFMPRTAKKHRLLSEILNTGKNFIAVKNCTLEYKINAAKSMEHHEFLEVNIASILIMRPTYEE